VQLFIEAHIIAQPIAHTLARLLL